MWQEADEKTPRLSEISTYFDFVKISPIWDLRSTPPASQTEIEQKNKSINESVNQSFAFSLTLSKHEAKQQINEKITTVVCSSASIYICRGVQKPLLLFEYSLTKYKIINAFA